VFQTSSAILENCLASAAISLLPVLLLQHAPPEHHNHRKSFPLPRRTQIQRGFLTGNGWFS